MHEKGFRIGNLRPQDLEFSTSKLGSKEPEFQFRVSSEKTMAKVDPKNPTRLVKKYGRLDDQFIHPRFADKLSTDDDARIDHDWFSYKTLLFWVFTKADPFGTGTVKDKPDADRKYRMKEELYCNNLGLEIDDCLKLFITRALNRLGIQVKMYIFCTEDKSELRKKPLVIETSFKKDLFKCDKITRKEGCDEDVRCNFSRLLKEAKCPYCEDAKRRKSIAYTPIPSELTRECA